MTQRKELVTAWLAAAQKLVLDGRCELSLDLSRNHRRIFRLHSEEEDLPILRTCRIPKPKDKKANRPPRGRHLT